VIAILTVFSTQAMALSLGATAVWVGTRFVAATEAGAPPRHQKGVVGAGYHDTVRTIIFTVSTFVHKGVHGEHFFSQRGATAAALAML
jgi:NAD(P)H-dependent flavin oxidoreductase YrpB (nitropropane dioxygenase family)